MVLRRKYAKWTDITGARIERDKKICRDGGFPEPERSASYGRIQNDGRFERVANFRARDLGHQHT
jgi:hypothetical protein